jgi:hypothetical protein
MFLKNKNHNQLCGSLALAVPFLFSDNPAIPDIPDTTFVCVLVVAADNTHWPSHQPPIPTPSVI